MKNSTSEKIRIYKKLIFFFLILIFFQLSACSFYSGNEIEIKPAEYKERGISSWYGVPYHGRKTASGEIYDMYGISAAHRTLPLGTVCKVYNLRNGKNIQVRINDRGPFVKNRILDLSYAAAKSLGFAEEGTTEVLIEVVSLPAVAQSFAVQVASFKNEKNALNLQHYLSEKYGNASVVKYDNGSDTFYRVRVGNFKKVEDAGKFIDQVKVKDSTPFVVARD